MITYGDIQPSEYEICKIWNSFSRARRQNSQYPSQCRKYLKNMFRSAVDRIVPKWDNIKMGETYIIPYDLQTKGQGALNEYTVEKIEATFELFEKLTNLQFLKKTEVRKKYDLNFELDCRTQGPTSEESMMLKQSSNCFNSLIKIYRGTGCHSGIGRVLKNSLNFMSYELVKLSSKLYNKKKYLLYFFECFTESI